MLRTRKSRREDALGAHVPEPVATGTTAAIPRRKRVLADSVGLALLVVLETLDAGGAARVRAPRHVRGAVRGDRVDRRPHAGGGAAAREPRAPPRAGSGRGAGADLARQREVVDAFLAALRGGDFEGLSPCSIRMSLVAQRLRRSGPAERREVRGARNWAKGADRGGARRALCAAGARRRQSRPRRRAEGATLQGAQLYLCRTGRLRRSRSSAIRRGCASWSWRSWTEAGRFKDRPLPNRHPGTGWKAVPYRLPHLQSLVKSGVAALALRDIGAVTLYTCLLEIFLGRDRFHRRPEGGMNRLLVAGAAIWLSSLALSAQSPQARPTAPAQRPAPAAQSASARADAAEPANETLKQYCVGCHSDRGKAGGLSLADFDVARAHEHPDTAEKIIRKLRGSMMPPSGARRPDEATLQDLRRALETRMDRWAAANPNPGWRPFQRLTRAEYTQAVRDLLDLDVDVTAFLPPDTMSHGFDNIADAQSFSPALPQGYLRAAAEISRLAVGDRAAVADDGDASRAGDRKPDALRRGDAVRLARRRRVRAHVPGRRHLPLRRDARAHGQRRAVRQHRDLHGAEEGTARDLGQRRARGGARSRPGHERRRREGADARDAADRGQGRAADGSRPRSCRDRSARSTICSRRSSRP